MTAAIAHTGRLVVDGAVEAPGGFDFAALRLLSDQVADVGEVVPRRVGTAVRLATVVKLVRPHVDAGFATLYSADGKFSASVPLAEIEDGLIVYRLGDEPLPETMGGPMRFLIPDVASCSMGAVDACANVKFLARIEITTVAGDDTRPTSERSHRELHEGE